VQLVIVSIHLSHLQLHFGQGVSLEFSTYPLAASQMQSKQFLVFGTGTATLVALHEC
jgi:hypothetical protein